MESKSQAQQCDNPLSDITVVETCIKDMITDIAPVNAEFKTWAKNASSYRLLLQKQISEMEKLHQAKKVSTSGSTSLVSAGPCLRKDLVSMVTVELTSMMFPTMATVGVDTKIACLYDNTPLHLNSSMTAKCCEEIAKHAYFVKQVKWLQKHRKSQRRLASHSAILEVPAETAIDSIVTTNLGFGTSLRTRYKIDSSETTIADVYEYQFFQQADQFSKISTAPYGTAEVRLIIEGHEALIGFKIQDQAGDNICNIFKQSGK